MPVLRRFCIAVLASGLSLAACAQQSTWFPAAGRGDKAGEAAPTCPPGAGRPFEKSEKDADIDKNGKTDRYLGEFRWDDKNGHDLRVEVWCMDDTYYSMRVYQSEYDKNQTGTHKETLVATPGGKDPVSGGTVADPGEC